MPLQSYLGSCLDAIPSARLQPFWKLQPHWGLWTPFKGLVAPALSWCYCISAQLGPCNERCFSVQGSRQERLGHSTIPHNYPVRWVLLCPFYRGGNWLRDVKEHAQGHTASRQRGKGDLNQASVSSYCCYTDASFCPDIDYCSKNGVENWGVLTATLGPRTAISQQGNIILIVGKKKKKKTYEWLLCSW